MSVKERDPLTGHQTTGHEWNGITELNTRVPRAIWFFIIVTHVWALFYWVLMPAWPTVNTYTKGLLGVDQRQQVEARVAAADAKRSSWSDPITSLTLDEVRSDPTLMAHVQRTAPALFGDNCAACHGAQAQGGPGYPSLVDQAWLWGSDDETVLETLRVGINAPHPESRFSQMMAFGRDGLLDREQIRIAADYVQSLSRPAEEINADRLAAGATLFDENCASCHGEDGTGSQDLGAPDLTDEHWIYGGDEKSIFNTIFHGRQGWMPAWEQRLSETERRILTIYLGQLKETHHDD